jgi:hypothetical protein
MSQIFCKGRALVGEKEGRRRLNSSLFGYNLHPEEGGAIHERGFQYCRPYRASVHEICISIRMSPLWGSSCNTTFTAPSGLHDDRFMVTSIQKKPCRGDIISNIWAPLTASRRLYPVFLRKLLVQAGLLVRHLEVVVRASSENVKYYPNVPPIQHL